MIKRRQSHNISLVGFNQSRLNNNSYKNFTMSKNYKINWNVIYLRESFSSIIPYRTTRYCMYFGLLSKAELEVCVSVTEVHPFCTSFWYDILCSLDMWQSQGVYIYSIYPSLKTSRHCGTFSATHLNNSSRRLHTNETLLETSASSSLDAEDWHAVNVVPLSPSVHSEHKAKAVFTGEITMKTSDIYPTLRTNNSISVWQGF